MAMKLVTGSWKTCLTLTALMIAFLSSPTQADEYPLPDIGKGDERATYAWLKNLTPREQAIYWDGFLAGFPPAIDSCYLEVKEAVFNTIMKHMEMLVEEHGVKGTEINPKMFYGKLMKELCPE